MPQIVFDVSTEMLSAALHNFVGRSLPCISGDVTITDIQIDSVVPTRGDQWRQTVTVHTQRDPQGVSVVTPTTHQASLPATLLAIAVSFHLLTGPELDITEHRDSDDTHVIRDLLQFRIVHFGFVPGSDGATRPLVVLREITGRLRALRTLYPSVDRAIAGMVADVMRAGHLTPIPPAPTDPATTPDERTMTPNDVPVPLGLISDLLQDFERTLHPPRVGFASPAVEHPVPRLHDAPLDVVNFGVIAQPSRDGTDTSLGLRVGLDVVLPPDASNWGAFYENAGEWPLDATADERWAVRVGKQLLEVVGQDLFADRLENDDEHIFDSVSVQWRAGTDPRAGSSIGPNVTVPPFESRWKGFALVMRAHARTRGGDPLGDISISLAPSQGTAPNAAGPPEHRNPALHLHACAEFDQDFTWEVGAAIFFAGLTSLFTGGVAPLLAGLLGGLVAHNVFDYYGDRQIESNLPGRSDSNAVPRWTPVDSLGCRETDIDQSLALPNIGTLHLRRVRADAEGMHFAGVLRPELGMLAPGRLAVTLDPAYGWEYPFTACHSPSSDPQRPVFVRNPGALPLKICAIEQRGMANAGVLMTDVLLPIELRGGETKRIEVVAQVTGRQSYDSSKPLWLRITSTGGVRDINLNNLNSGNVAKPISATEAERSDLLSRLFCIGRQLTEVRVGAIRLGPIRYTDPIPFDRTDVVHERIDFVTPISSGRFAVRALDLAGLVLARASSSTAHALHLSASMLRGGATTHHKPFLRLEVVEATLSSVSSHVRQAPSAYAVERTLYRQGPAFVLAAPIVAAARHGRELIVATRDRLYLASVHQGGLARWRSRAITGLSGVARAHGHWLAASTAGLMVLDDDLDLVAHPHRSALRALGARRESFWIAEVDGVTRFHLDGVALPQQSPTKLPGLPPGGHMRLPDVQALVALSSGVFALVGGSLWEVSGEEPRALGVRAHRLGAIDEAPLAVGKRGALLCDAAGRVQVEYTEVPWIASLVEWPDVAVEIRRNDGMLVLHDRYPTSERIEVG